jgi:hypothetical protein
MTPRHRLNVLSDEQLLHLTQARLLAYRKKALSLWNAPEDSDYSPAEFAALDAAYIWFKSDPRWEPMYQRILAALSRAQSQK